MSAQPSVHWRGKFNSLIHSVHVHSVFLVESNVAITHENDLQPALLAFKALRKQSNQVLLSESLECYSLEDNQLLGLWVCNHEEP